MARSKKANKARVINALSEMPIVEAACKKAGVSRATYYRWLKEDKEFEQEVEKAVQQGDDRISGLAESKLVNLIQESHLPAIRFWLNNRSNRFGFPKRQLTKKPGLITRAIQIYDMRNKKKMKLVEDTDDENSKNL